MKMATVKEQQDLEKQIGNHIGCMAGFFHIFDRPHILSPKRFHSPKRLPPSPDVESEPVWGKSSPLRWNEFGYQKQQSRSPTPELRSPAPESATSASENLTRSPLTLPIIEFKEGTRSPWKFSREAPRLSLDSRAVVDAKGSLRPRQIRAESGILPATRRDSTDDESQRRTPSVIARLMGLEPLPSSDPEPSQIVELRRSASESRVNREYRFVNAFNFQVQQSQNLQSSISSNLIRKEKTKSGDEDLMEYSVRSTRAEPVTARALSQQRCVVRRKHFFDSTDFFPEPRKTGSIDGDLEKRIKTRGIDEHSNDLETLKQLLEALQLKGLLHSSNQPRSQTGNRNFVFDNYESPVKPARSPAHLRQSGDSSHFGFRSEAGARAAAGGAAPSVSPRRDRGAAYCSNARNQSKERSWVLPTRSESSVKSPSRRPLWKESPEQQRRVSSVQSPKVTWRRPEPVRTANRSKRGRTTEVHGNEDELTTISRSSMIGTCCEGDKETWKVEEYHKEGKSLLERCDKLLHSIAEMTAAATTESQPSPVSVLDSSLYHEESSPSPVMKRSLDFTAQSFSEPPIESEDETWGSVVSLVEFKSDDSEFVYVSDIVRASDYLPEDSDIFLLLEKQQYLKGKCTSKAATQERRLIFDTIQEILNRRRQLPPWRAAFCSNSSNGQTSLQQIWSEFQKIRDRKHSSSEEEDLVSIICSVLGRDFSEDAINGWEDRPVEVSEAVLDIERLIFKDLITETIRNLAALSDNSSRSELLRRKLVF